ncbi:hypothetical protein KP79_PYT09316 [Mizuhopecten yessoensis]|uniref:Uncharacterized protein n=1 Tax=Mizuhopecten yessoensis TaxID=6573 RepID=A0A210QCF1_MIZYE|nr:hypothetical protein KP79_PYT09316 [Mizuhopecten yessoensis]
MELDDLRRSSVSSFEDMRQETPSPFRAVPRGSDVFQKAMVQLYNDMQTEKEKKRQRRQNARSIDEEDDFSDEERDKCTDIKQFRRFSQDFSAKQHNFRRTASLHQVSPKLSLGSAASPQIPSRLQKLSEIRTSDKKQSQILRRHSITILSPVDNAPVVFE